jgi:hypothetical protein
MKRFTSILLLISSLLAVSSCFREKEMDIPDRYSLPDGTPVVLTLGFGADDLQDVQIGTKAEVSRADESRIHDLYVLIFAKEDDPQSNVYRKIYGRYFTYEHQSAVLDSLLDEKHNNEGWFVENLQSNSAPGSKTRGVVKISTVSKADCKLVLLANISNTVSSIKDPRDPDNKDKTALDWLSSDDITYSDFQQVNVTLEQNVVNRSNLFLMMGMKESVNTGQMAWNKTDGTLLEPATYGTDYRINLTPLDAKIKFRVKYDETNISGITPRYWRAFNLPDRCMLAPSDKTPGTITGQQFFTTDEAYFEGTETVDDVTWQVFTFYMLESKPSRRNHAASYNDRDKWDKDPDTGENLSTWANAPQDGAYVFFDVILNLTVDGIRNILDDPDANHALTSDAKFTIHLGDFSGSSQDRFDNYKVERGHSYTYNINIVNSKSIYVEVMSDQENESGHEGSLLLTTDDIINCDAHYEYHNMVFKANPAMATGGDMQSKISWFIKTPFGESGPAFKNNHYEIPLGPDGKIAVDYDWVKFGLNSLVNGLYTDKRFRYPGDDKYRPDWDPAAWNRTSNPVPPLININQLVNLLYDQNLKKANNQDNLFDSSGELHFTAFVDEYYYEVDPKTGELDPDLWREFINAKPREMHVLSQAVYSKDGNSDVIQSSHSIIQNSIQTFYNTFSPDLSSVWGTEHLDENRNRGAADAQTGVNKSWSWWHNNWEPTGIIKDEENGRLNTASIWGLDDAPSWDSFLDYEVENNMPELRSNFQYMAYSCLTRNRDNNGNGIIDPEELRWYTAAINQLVGMWIGNESLSQSARIYQPIDATNKTDALKWRAHVLSSTCPSTISNPRVVRGEEGATKSFYEDWSWAFPENSPEEYRDRVSSIRCVRNAGTFRKNGAYTDITEAPFDQMVDQYFEVPMGTNGDGRAFPNSDGTYTIRFSRLNSKSIREYTSDDLPYHDEYSYHNRVYLELHLQNPDNTVYADGKLKHEGKALNDTITKVGHNTYCPPGYRLPNMTELLVMSNLAPTTYWNQTGKSGKELFPCRTYFTRGSNGNNTTSTESGKIGWQYRESDQRVNMANTTAKMTGIRCVRDQDMTGDITGKVMVNHYDSLRNNQRALVELNFSSMASAIRRIELELVYMDATGEHSIRINEADDLSISGVTLKDTLSFKVPAAGSSWNQLPVRGWMKVRATVLNAAGISRKFETPVRVLSDMAMSIKLLPCDYDGRSTDYSFPVLVTAYDKVSEITTWKLRIVAPDKSVKVVELGTPNALYATTIYQYNPYDNGGTLLTGTYTFQLEATSTNSQTHATETVRSELVSMDVLHVNWRPIPVDIIAAAQKAADLKVGENGGRWEREKIEGLDFVSGDFIETDMDISLCEFKTAVGVSANNKTNLGMDILISVGLNGIDWVPWVFNVDFPSVATGPEGLYLNPTWLSGTQVASAGYIYSYPSRDIPVHFRLEKGGAYWNGQKVDVGKWGANQNNVQSVIDKLTAANTLYIGSTEGDHRSRALYRFVRVVHNGRDSSIEGDDSYFNDNPGFGGKL